MLMRCFQSAAANRAASRSYGFPSRPPSVTNSSKSSIPHHFVKLRSGIDADSRLAELLEVEHREKFLTQRIILARRYRYCLAVWPLF